MRIDILAMPPKESEICGLSSAAPIGIELKCPWLRSTNGQVVEAVLQASSYMNAFSFLKLAHGKSFSSLPRPSLVLVVSDLLEPEIETERFAWKHGVSVVRKGFTDALVFSSNAFGSSNSSIPLLRRAPRFMALVGNHYQKAVEFRKSQCADWLSELGKSARGPYMPNGPPQWSPANPAVRSAQAQAQAQAAWQADQ